MGMSNEALLDRYLTLTKEIEAAEAVQVKDTEYSHTVSLDGSGWSALRRTMHERQEKIDNLTDVRARVKAEILKRMRH